MDVSNYHIPGDEPIVIKSRTRTFNHVNEYAIHGGRIWFRPRLDSDRSWEPLHFDGVYPVEIHADGANLAVLDHQNHLHYKKILDEKRKGGSYSCTDLTKEHNWLDRWFTFPLVEKVYHLFHKKRLQIPPETPSWAMSHRGIFNRYFEDARGKKRKKFSMVTTLYILSDDGKEVRYADPFLVSDFNHIIEGPHPDFTACAMSASASHILLLGVQEGETKMYRRRADFDTMGNNPCLPGFWNKNCRADPSWIEIHGLPDDAINNISISQIGEGDKAYVIHLEGAKGIYEKRIDDEHWTIITDISVDTRDAQEQ